MRYVVLGAGAIGCSVGGLLLLAGRSVAFVARGAQLAALRTDGLSLATPTASHQVQVEACSAADLGWDADDVVLLCTKSQDSPAALDAIDVSGRAVVCMQNGVANEPLVVARGATAYGAMVYMPSSYLRPGRVTIHSAPCPGVVDVGVHPAGIDALTRRIAGDLCAATMDSCAVEAIAPLKYGKLLSNLGNVLQALVGSAALELPEDRPLRKDVVAEAMTVLDAARIPVVPLAELYRRCEAIVDEAVDGERRPGGSSWQSLAREQPLETDHLNGEIVRLGREHRVPTPLNTALVALSERASREKWPPAKLTFDELSRALSGSAR